MVFKGADHLGRYRSSTMSFNIDDFNFINTPLLEEDTEMEAPSLPVALDLLYKVSFYQCFGYSTGKCHQKEK